MTICIYCGKPAGELDEHEECIEHALEVALIDAPTVAHAQAMLFAHVINRRRDE